jgi:hypothetical protein
MRRCSRSPRVSRSRNAAEGRRKRKGPRRTCAARRCCRTVFVFESLRDPPCVRHGEAIVCMTGPHDSSPEGPDSGVADRASSAAAFDSRGGPCCSWRLCLLSNGGAMRVRRRNARSERHRIREQGHRPVSAIDIRDGCRPAGTRSDGASTGVGAAKPAEMQTESSLRISSRARGVRSTDADGNCAQSRSASLSRNAGAPCVALRRDRGVDERPSA